MMASCVVTLSKSRFEIAARSRDPNTVFHSVSPAFFRTSIANKLCSRSARFTASTSAARDVAGLNIASVVLAV